jgi:uncharacterized damage-inducible protein DinB
MDQTTAAEALRQVFEGADFTPPTKMLSRLTAEQAAARIPSAPYSILTLVAHADFWQRIWLARLGGEKRPSIIEDWRVPNSTEWQSLRKSWLEGMTQAIQIASRKPFEHKAKNDATAVKFLLEIALHNSYHMGQIALLKRMARKPK